MPTDSIEKFETKWRDNDNYVTALAPGDLASVDFDRLLLATLYLDSVTWELTDGYDLGDFVNKIIAVVAADTGPPATVVSINTVDEADVPNLVILYPVPQPEPVDFEDTILSANVRAITNFALAPGAGTIEFWGSKDITFEDFEDGWVSVL